MAHFARVIVKQVLFTSSGAIEPILILRYNGSMRNRNKIRVEAQKLRDVGYSYNMINKELGVVKSTLSNWFKDRPFTPNKEVLKRIQYGPIKAAEKNHNRKVREIKELKELGSKEIGILTKRDLWLLGLGLYMGEGSKSYETIRIINSDSDVIKLAIKWFKEICGVTNRNITVAVHLYPDNNVNICLRFWSRVTHLPLSRFRKTQIDTRKNKSITKKRKLPYGTAHITIVSKNDPEKGVRLYRRLNGWIAGALSQI